jgi:hypothetical protein
MKTPYLPTLEAAVDVKTGLLTRAWVQFHNFFASLLAPGSQTGGAVIWFGTGSPNGVVSAAQGSIGLRTDGGAGTTLYVRESGAATNWTAK